MEKIITKILLVLFFSITLIFGSSSIREIEGLYKKIPYASKNQTAYILHELENLYISSVVASDKEGTIKSLRGIIKCQKLLGLNSKTYESELSSLTHSKNHIKPKTAKKPKQVSKPTYRHKEKKSSKPIYKKPYTPKSEVLKILSIKQKKNSIIIKFDRPLTKSKMLFFEINRHGNYRDIYDFQATINCKIPKLSMANVKQAKIAQNNSKKVRLVLEDRKKIYSNAYIRGVSLFVEIQKNPLTTKRKPIVTSSPIITKKRTQKVNTPKATKQQPTSTIYASSKIIVIDPGHGGKDSGAVGYKKYKEKHAVLKIAKLLKSKLSKKGYKVYLTRSDDRFIKLSKRTHFANLKHADLFISIHANASSKAQKLTLKGVETFFLSPAKTAKAKRIAAKENKSAVTSMTNISKDTLLSLLNRNKIIQSNKLAIDIQKNILSQVRKKYKDTKDGGVREAPFYVLVGAQMPAVLVEIGYITNPTEADRLFNPFYQKSLATGIANGINNYFINNN
jgi:N-acetylmuramoyl-L-alanine amidase